MSNELPKLGVAAIVKNELADLREWLAFHLAVGVSHFLIADNESSDGTREYLQLLESLGLVTRVEVPTVGEEKPQLPAYRELLARCPADLDLLAFIDADEYLLPLASKEAAPSLLPWLADVFADEAVGALALNWACFGSSGARFREEGLVIERFRQRAPRTFRTNRHYKSIVRPDCVGKFLNPHHVELSRGHYVNGQGDPLEPLEARPGLSRQVVWAGARVNHYIIKSVEEFLLGKSARGSAATPGYHKGPEYFQRFDRNDKTCRLAERLAPEVHRQLLALPVVQSVAERSRRRPGMWRSLRRLLPGEGTAPATSPPAPVSEWSLQTPTADWVVRSQRGLLFQGRVVLATGHGADDVALRVAWEEESDLVHPLALERRPDGRDVAVFRLEVPRAAGTFALRLSLDERLIELGRLSVAAADTPSPERGAVLVGRQGWLFLDQDTNASVHQHCGQLQLNATGLRRWSVFAEEFKRLAATHGADCALLVAPSKERVMQQYHPLPAAEAIPVDQVAAALPTSLLVYPLEALRDLGDEAYYVTDTHWTHRGALAATLATLRALGRECEAVDALFAADEYAPVQIKGDLGGKLSPVRTATAQRQTSFHHETCKRYDNGLPNMGRMIAWENPDALYGRQHCLLFGASSSLSMFQFLVRLFGRLTFVHSAGSVDPALVEALAPDVLLAQTNARFMARAPTLTFSLAEVIADKAEEVRQREAPMAADRRTTVVSPELARLGLVTWDRALPAGWFAS
ncbi:glycosyltransferase family 2 protein [Halomonas maura]|uniref:glycosyltransferase family 2 protein n=1 Tax=Halomonas maura TaxID=117606 RepID=UPI0025B31B8F|nr:glycosyltransferase family 2 protein [Halomonas maura]MDN3557458.1 glycosyltransferase family 2 protein [Halomonas maura]